ncbi:MAG: hypothetical protein MHPSP_001077 [Paramarteilia canceri]
MDPILAVNFRQIRLVRCLSTFEVKFHPWEFASESKGTQAILERYKKAYQNNNSSNNFYSLVLPPPNVTGDIHIGTSLSAIFLDFLARKKHQQGYSVSFVPGTDHGGISLQNTLQNKYKKELLSNPSLFWKNFDDNSIKFATKNEQDICGSLKKLSLCLDWSSYFFTLDSRCQKTSYKALEILKNHDLLYTEKKIVKWCPYLQTTLSDIEVEHREVEPMSTISIPSCKSHKYLFGRMFKISYKILEKPGNQI